VHQEGTLYQDCLKSNGFLRMQAQKHPAPLVTVVSGWAGRDNSG
jgi:hypothetical protein